VGFSPIGFHGLLRGELKKCYFAGAEILLTVSSVPLGNADRAAETAADQMELQVETEIQGDEVTAGRR
jgi:hypothetical protein